ncbi:MAG: hypothetical protein MJ118_07530, partial [Clostridia bacterium]|nr:hypothetical protein [Clostridia bacterium]
MDELRQNEIDSDRTGRSLPLQVSYHGFPVYVRLEYINLADGKERRIAKVVISYREQFKEAKKPRKKQYGKAVLERKYSPVGEGTREEVIQSTIEAVVPTAFLPELFHVAPELMTGNLACAVVLPTARIRLEAMQTVTAETTAKRRKAMTVILQLWGDLSVKDLTPERCAPGILSMGTAMATNCISLLRALFAGFLTQIVDDPHIWERYRVTGRKTRTSLEATERRNLLPPVLTEDQCRQMMLRCINGLSTRYADRYIAAALMLVTGISVDEICALDLRTLKEGNEYAVWYVDIDKSLQPSKNGKKYSINPQTNKYRHRRVALGRWIMGLLHPLIEAGRTLVLRNPSNPLRTLSPKIFEQWLDDTFGELITNKDKISVVDSIKNA